MPQRNPVHTEQYTSLEKRVTTLCTQYLPTKRDPLGDYSDNQRNDGDACVVLVHAAIETYLEHIAQSLASLATKQIETGQFDWLTSHFIFNAGKRAEIKGTEGLTAIAKGFEGLLTRIINSNHGIKEKNVIKLFAPFGPIAELFDADTLASLNTFGVKRGEIAHLDFKAGTRSINEPFETKGEIEKLLDGLREFDTLLLERVPDLLGRW